MVRLESLHSRPRDGLSKECVFIGKRKGFLPGNQSESTAKLPCNFRSDQRPTDPDRKEIRPYGRDFCCLKTTDAKYFCQFLRLFAGQSGTAQGALFLSPKPLLERSDLVRARIPSNWVVRSHG